ncbi:MAG: RluA family pseudouridine synthase [Bacteroidales bacterium]|nr:RluA family pseudouridine synthase [Bacteroidales bacterium]
MLNNPFCYTPSPSIVAAARALIDRIDADPGLRKIFAEGKMLGILEVEGSQFLYAFSGLAGGSAFVEGFVPPIFAWKPEDIISSSAEESRRLQDWLFEQYVVLNGRGERRSIRQIFADRGLVPPGGTGDCAAPKLLQYALQHSLKPLAIGEFWYGASPAREVRRSGAFYPACTGKCGPLLGYMLQGVDVEPNPLESDAHWLLTDPVVRYEDADLIVAEKPAGMLAVPGRPVPGVAPRRSLQDWLADYCGQPVFACHRLDMDTSGLMVFAKTPEAQAALQRQFENREVSKAYLASVMAGETPLKAGDRGKISLPLAPDWYDRPRQMVDREGGKPAVTDYEVLRVDDDGTAFVRLIPYTGRTHQLRVHCAHPAGLGRPILGDRLYGGDDAPRLMLHAAHLSFRHPSDGRRMTFESDFQ